MANILDKRRTKIEEKEVENFSLQNLIPKISILSDPGNIIAFFCFLFKKINIKASLSLTIKFRIYEFYKKLRRY